MKDDHDVNSPARQQAAVMEQQATNQKTQERSTVMEQNAAERKGAIQQCTNIVGQSLDQQTDRIRDCMEQAASGEDLKEAAEQMRRDCKEAVSLAADRANKLIDTVLSDRDANPDSSQRQLDCMNAAAEMAQQYAVNVDERTRQLGFEVEDAFDKGKEDDTVRDRLQEAQNDFNKMRDDLDCGMQQLLQEQEAGRSENDRSAQHVDADRQQQLSRAELDRITDEVEKEGRQTRAEDLHDTARGIGKKDLIEQIQSGIRSPALEELEQKLGRDTVSDYADGKLKQKDAGFEFSHNTSVKEAPEWATKPENLEPLTRRDHQFGVHGNDFGKERNGVPADPNIDEHSGFNVDEDSGPRYENEDLDKKVQDASEYQPHDAEDAMIEEIDRRREQEAEEQRRAQDAAEEQRRAQERDVELIAAERAKAQRDAERASDEAAAREREEHRQAEERAAQQRQEQQRAAQQHEEARVAAERERQRSEEEAARKRREQEGRNGQ